MCLKRGREEEEEKAKGGSKQAATPRVGGRWVGWFFTRPIPSSSSSSSSSISSISSYPSFSPSTHPFAYGVGWSPPCTCGRLWRVLWRWVVDPLFSYPVS